MSGYTPLFSSLTTGTLCGRWPDIGLWPIILSLGDKNGVVDVTPAYIAGVTGLPLDEVSACMKRFCEPDPFSRTAEAGGARLMLLESHRDWGWVIVNHSKYREKARKQMQQIQATQSGRDAERKRDQRSLSCYTQSADLISVNLDNAPDAQHALHNPLCTNSNSSPAMSGDVQRCPAMSGADRLSDSDTDLKNKNIVEHVFDHWRATHEHPKAKLDPKRKRVIEAAGKLYPLSDLCKAITGYKKSKWHMGDNPEKRRYDDIELMLRNAKQIEQGLRFVDAPDQEQGKWM